MQTGFTNIMPKLRAIMIKALDLVTKSARSHAVWSPSISRAIFIGKIVQNQFVITGQFGVDLKKAPEGRAFEYGSGLHSTIGQVGPILIRPKNVPSLVFEGTHEWSGQTIIVPPMGGGVVKHPGVAERPYMRPAMQDTQATIHSMLDQEFRQFIAGSIKMAWSRTK